MLMSLQQLADAYNKLVKVKVSNANICLERF
jgi:hypothetical protein